jgi:glycine cleavage system regulatory protein
MNTPIVLTIIADDQPGIIETVAKALKKHDGNWTQSSMSSLAGQFAGILLASVPGDKTDACLAELRALESKGLQIIVRASADVPQAENANEFSMELVGNDHPGIVHDITRVLAAHKVSVTDLETSVEGASMGGGELFKASARLLVPESSDIHALETELEELANDLMVDLHLER